MGHSPRMLTAVQSNGERPTLATRKTGHEGRKDLGRGSKGASPSGLFGSRSASFLKAGLGGVLLKFCHPNGI